MNANRMRYSVTPTYGIQKRGFLKRPAQPVRQAPESPDFSQVPEPSASFQQPFAQPAAPVAFSPSGATFPAAAPVNGPMMGPTVSVPMTGPSPLMGSPSMMGAAPMMGSMPVMGTSPMAGVAPFMQQPGQQTTQIPFATPTFVPPAGGSPFAAPSNQQLPLGNSAPAINPQNPFSLRGQGYVPPTRTQNAPNVQSAPFASAPQPVMPFASQPAGFAQSPQMQQSQQAAFMNFAPTAPQQPAAFTPQQQTKKPRKSLNADQLLSIFLFGLLPLLFIPCIFLSSSFDFLRYAFMALSVAGLGAMWYRQSYAPATRLIVSMVYVALCIVCIAMMMQGVQDNRRTASGGVEPASAQVSAAPSEDPSLMGAVPEETPAPAEPTPTPEGMGASQAQQRLETFMTLWEGNNVNEMVNLVQPSWASAQENRTTALFMLLANRTPEDFTIEEVGGSEQDSSRTITMTATINKNNGKTPTVYRFMVMMVKEGEDWYVNPNSLATNDEVTTSSGSDDENVVNNKNAGGLATEPPRTTVTPAPPASTTLYYNPNGGSYYHLDAYCPSVKEEYLPLTGTFSYRELGEYKSKGLLPCIKCSAPVNTLAPEEQ